MNYDTRKGRALLQIGVSTKTRKGKTEVGDFSFQSDLSFQSIYEYPEVKIDNRAIG
jgi:hypothetical protein